MKKIISAISTIVLSMGLMAGVASADEDSCIISGTGPDSNNVCQFDSRDNVIYTCSSGILVVNGTNQSATSGATQSENNTSTEEVASGDAINENEFTTNVNATCGPVAVAPNPQGPAPVKPQGQAEDKAAPATAKKQVAEAPRGGVNAGAGGSTATSIAAIAGLVASIGAVASGAFMFKKFLV